MKKEFLPFSRPAIGADEIRAVAEVMRSGWITTGARCAEFEARFAAYCGAAGAVAVSSATAGMHLLLAALGIGPGDEVVTPSMTWVSTVNLIVLAGATPVFADIDRDTLMLTPETVEPCLSERTRAIVPVHFAGAALDLDPLRDLAAARGIVLLEDAAHAAGTGYKGRMVGESGTAVFSFHPIKNMTCGEGGMVVSDDQELLERVRRLRFHGLGVDAYDRSVQGRAPQAEVIEPGYKYNLTDMAAALGLVQLGRLDQFIAERAILAERYRKRLAGIPGITPLAVPAVTTRHAWHLFIVRVEPGTCGLDRDGFMAALKERGIGTGLHFRAVHTQKYYRERMPQPAGSLAATEWNSERICSLPLFPGMGTAAVDRVCDAIGEVLDAA